MSVISYNPRAHTAHILRAQQAPILLDPQDCRNFISHYLLCIRFIMNILLLHLSLSLLLLSSSSHVLNAVFGMDSEENITETNI